MLPSKLYSLLRTHFQAYPEIDKVFLYGSRAHKQHHAQSDIDLALWGPHLSEANFARLRYALTYELPTLIPIEIARLDGASPDFVERVQQKGVMIYERKCFS